MFPVREKRFDYVEVGFGRTATDAATRSATEKRIFGAVFKTVGKLFRKKPDPKQRRKKYAERLRKNIKPKPST